MQICFLKDPIEFPHLKIDDQQVELVTSHKVLGRVIQNNLKWNNHIESIVTTARPRSAFTYSEYFIVGALRLMI